MIVYNKNSAAFLRSPPHPQLFLREISPRLGRGWFAKASIPAGTLLWKEDPLVTANSLTDLVQLMQQDDDFTKYEHLCRKTTSTNSDDGEEEVTQGIAHCNHFCVRPDLFLLFHDISLLNHSCNPNVSVILQEEGGEEEEEDEEEPIHALVQTARSIAPGDELVISYSSEALFWSWPVRQEYWQSRWGFSCTCERCRLDQQKRKRQHSSPTIASSSILLQSIWPLLEEAAAIAEQSKPRQQSVDPKCLQLQQQAAAVVEQRLPCLKEGERFQADAAYFR